MAVAFDAKGTSNDSHSGTSTGFTSTKLTVGSGANRALIVGIVFGSAIPTGIAVHWDSTGTNQAMTLIGTATQSTTCQISLYGLLAPTSGNKTVNLTWNSASVNVYADYISFTGVDQTAFATSFTNFSNTHGGSGTSAITNTVSTAANDATVQFGGTADADSAISSVNQTQIFIDGSGSNNGAGQYQIIASGTSSTLTLTLSGATATGFAGAACNLVAVGQAGGAAGPGPLFDFGDILVRKTIPIGV